MGFGYKDIIEIYVWNIRPCSGVQCSDQCSILYQDGKFPLEIHFPFLVSLARTLCCHLTSEMATPHPHLQHLKAISQEQPTCTLFTSDGGRMEVLVKIQSYFVPVSPWKLFFSFQVQSHLLSLLSPFLASLLAQAGPQPIISLPYTDAVLRWD